MFLQSTIPENFIFLIVEISSRQFKIFENFETDTNIHFMQTGREVQKMSRRFEISFITVEKFG